MVPAASLAILGALMRPRAGRDLAGGEVGSILPDELLAFRRGRNGSGVKGGNLGAGVFDVTGNRTNATGAGQADRDKPAGGGLGSVANNATAGGGGHFSGLLCGRHRARDCARPWQTRRRYGSGDQPGGKNGIARRFAGASI